jgi:hypothetical protein
MMTATDRADAFDVGVAHVNFRVRCETLGHGDEVFLCSDEGQNARKVGLDMRAFLPINVLSCTRWREHELF